MKLFCKKKTKQLVAFMVVKGKIFLSLIPLTFIDSPWLSYLVSRAHLPSGPLASALCPCNLTHETKQNQKEKQSQTKKKKKEEEESFHESCGAAQRVPQFTLWSVHLHLLSGH